MIRDAFTISENLAQTKPEELDPSLKTLELRRAISQAINLKNSIWAKDKFEAQKIFETIMGDKHTSFELSVFAMFNLCYLLLDELKIYGEKQVLKEAEELAKSLYNLALNSNSNSLTVESVLLQYKFALLNGEVHEAITKLNEAIELAKENENLAENVKREKLYFDNELNKLTSLTSNSSIYKRLEKTKVKDYIDGVLRDLEETKENYV